MTTGEMAKENGICCHCYIDKSGGGRGICNRCYKDIGIRQKYAPHASYKTGHGLKMGTVTDEWQPTEYLPGTPEKVNVLVYRASRGWPLWHPNDATHESMEDVKQERA